MGIKDLIPANCSLCKYTWEVFIYMVLTSKAHLGPNIWPKTPKQAESTKDMMRLIWGKEVYWQYKASATKSYSLSPSSKEARFVGPSHYYGHLVTNWNIDFGFYHEF